MNVTILCPCGRRLNVTGVAPGKSGKCPSCGGVVRVPESSPMQAEPVEEDEWNWQGTYDLGPTKPSETGRAVEPVEGSIDGDDRPLTTGTPIEEDEWNWEGVYDLRPTPAPATGEPSQTDEASESIPASVSRVRTPKPEAGRLASPHPEGWWPPSLLYPLRAAEGVAMAAALGASLWVMGTLVPEYCLALIADGEKLGTPTMGRLVSLITALPVLLLIPPTLVYWLQYLARVLVAGAEGEYVPPRPPDRNFDGLLSGLSRWLIWLVLGVGIGLLPLAAYVAAVSGGAGWNPRVAVGLGLLGVPYALMALLMAFLHDDALAATPWVVIATTVRFAPSFLVLCLTTAATLGLGGGAFAAAFALRAGHFYVYVASSLACWMLTVWTSIVAMHTLGVYYRARRDRLGWREERARWGVAWKL